MMHRIRKESDMTEATELNCTPSDVLVKQYWTKLEVLGSVSKTLGQILGKFF